MEDKLDRKIRPPVKKLKEILFSHKKFEGMYFYPQLDERFTGEQRKKVSEKIREVIS